MLNEPYLVRRKLSSCRAIYEVKRIFCETLSSINCFEENGTVFALKGESIEIQFYKTMKRFGCKLTVFSIILC